VGGIVQGQQSQSDSDAFLRVVEDYIIQGDHDAAVALLVADAGGQLNPPEYHRLVRVSDSEEITDALKDSFGRLVSAGKVKSKDLSAALSLAEELQSDSLYDEVAKVLATDMTTDLDCALVHVRHLWRTAADAVQVRDFATTFVSANIKTLDALSDFVSSSAKLRDDVAIKAVFDGACIALEERNQESVAYARVLALGVRGGVIERVGAAAKMLKIGKAVATGDYAVVQSDLFEVDAEVAVALWRMRFADACNALSPDLILELVRSGATHLNADDWGKLLHELQLNSVYKRADSALHLLTAMDIRVRSGGDILHELDVLVDLIVTHANDASVITYFYERSGAWKLWLCDDLQAIVERSTTSLRSPSRELIDAVFLLSQGENSRARRTLDGAALHMLGSLQPLAEELVVVSRLYRVGSFSGPHAAPPKGAEVLVICERGADPSAIMSMEEMDYEITYCSMDNWGGRHAVAPKAFWSLRDLFLDADPASRALNRRMRQLSEGIVSSYINTQSSVLASERHAHYQRMLSVALEDAVEGTATMASCMLRAVHKFPGKYVVLALKGAAMFSYFSESFLSYQKTMYVSVSGRNPASAASELVGCEEKKKPARAAATASPAAVAGFFEAQDRRSFAELIQTIPRTDRPAVLFMGAFKDPIYVDNVIPIIRGLLVNYDVYVLEVDAIGICTERLVEAFGEDLKATGEAGNELRLIDFSTEMKAAMRGLRKDAAVLQTLADEALSAISAKILSLDGLDLGVYFKRILPGLLRSVVLRYQICTSFYEQLFASIEFDGLFACSERLPVRMSAVEAANKFAVKTVDVMAVNSVKLPRYRPARANFVTAIDTVNTNYFTEFYGLPESRVVLTGSPRMDKILGEINSSDPAKTRSCLGVGDKTKVILYACQLQPIDRCISILEQLIKVVESEPDSVLLVKLHRRENEAREKIYFETASRSPDFDRIRLIRDDEYLSDIVHSLRIADVVVSMYSNALREAACVGAPFVAADYFETPLPFDYVANGLGVRAGSEEELVDTVHRILMHGPDKLDTFRRQQFLSNNPQLLDGSSVERIANVLRES